MWTYYAFEIEISHRRGEHAREATAAALLTLAQPQNGRVGWLPLARLALARLRARSAALVRPTPPSNAAAEEHGAMPLEGGHAGVR